MEFWSLYSFTFFKVALLFVMLNYCWRALGSTHRHLVLNDYVFIYLQSVIVAIILLTSLTWLHIVTYIILLFIFILQWTNAAAQRYYGIKVNWHMIKTFGTGVGEFGGEAKDSFVKLIHEVTLLATIVAFVISLTSLFFLSWAWLCFSYVGFYVLILNVLSKSKLDRFTIWLWLAGLILFEVGVYFLLPHLHPYPTSVAYNRIVFGLSIVLVLLYLWHFFTKKTFFVLPSLLRQQFRDEKLSLSILNNPPQLNTEDKTLAELHLQSFAKSEQFGKAENASVVLITMESLTNYYFTPEMQKEIMPFFSQLTVRGLQSKHHISPSALTNNALRILYAGAYSNATSYPHMQHLKGLDYQTCFMTSQKVAEFNLDKILQDIGFENIIDNYSLSGKRTQRINDPEFFPQAFAKLEQSMDLTKPFFLHIMNNQTHGPYFTYDKKVIDRKERYFQAIKETDQHIQTLVQQLRAYNDNLIVIYTGDHGESFGEEGYLSHSNSVLQPQIQVPFVIDHPNLTQAEIDFSSHFDVFPTLFDLLGTPYAYQLLGQTLYNRQINPHCFAYCETRMGNTPSSFAMLTPLEKIYFDRHLGNYQMRNLQDKVLGTFTGEKYQYYLKLMLLGLQERGLVF